MFFTLQVKYDFLFDVHHTSCLEVWPSQQWRRRYTVCLSVMVFLVPMLTMAILYGTIMRELWGKHRIHEAVFQTLPGSEINKITRSEQRRSDVCTNFNSNAKYYINYFSYLMLPHISFGKSFGHQRSFLNH